MNKKLVFRESNIYGYKTIEVGRWAETISGSKYLSTILHIDPINRYVMTDCGDSYMDYSIWFDDLLATADKIKKLETKHES